MKNDAKSLSAREQEAKRGLAIKLYAEGFTQAKVGELMGVSRETVSRWFRKHRQGGAAALKSKRRGKVLGSGRHLRAEDERHIQQMIVDKRPDQLKMSFALWTRQAVAELIYQELGIEMPIRTVGEYLKRWGMTPQKPLKQAYEQSPQAVQPHTKDTHIIDTSRSPLYLRSPLKFRACVSP